MRWHWCIECSGRIQDPYTNILYLGMGWGFYPPNPSAFMTKVWYTSSSVSCPHLNPFPLPHQLLNTWAYYYHGYIGGRTLEVSPIINYHLAPMTSIIFLIFNSIIWVLVSHVSITWQIIVHYFFILYPLLVDH